MTGDEARGLLLDLQRGCGAVVDDLELRNTLVSDLCRLPLEDGQELVASFHGEPLPTARQWDDRRRWLACRPAPHPLERIADLRARMLAGD